MGFFKRGKSVAPPILSVPCLMRNPDACGVEWHLILEFQSLLFMEKFEESVGDYIWENLSFLGPRTLTKNTNNTVEMMRKSLNCNNSSRNMTLNYAR